MLRKPALIITGVVLGLFIVVGVLWVPGHNRAGVHPALLAIEEPVMSLKAGFYFDGGTIALEIVDARGKAFAFFLPVEQRGNVSFYPNLVVGAYHRPVMEEAKQPLSEDSRRFLAMLIDKYADQGIDRHFCLEALRNSSRDKLRMWWYVETYDG